MSRSIFQNLPEAQQVLKLPTDELAGYLIEHFHSLSFGQRQQATVHNLANDISSRYRARNDEVYRVISIACQWLINRGFLVPIGPQGILITTDEGGRATTATKMKSWMREIKGIKPVLTTGLPRQQSSQNSKTSTEVEKSRETDFDHANELYEKVRHLFNQAKSLDEGTAKLIVEAADDAIKEFGSTNQEKKVELKQLRAQAVSVLPPETLEELKKRAEGVYLRRLYPKNTILQKLLIGIIGLVVIATIIVGAYKTFFDGNGTAKQAEVKPSPTAIPTNNLSPNPTPVTSPGISPGRAQQGSRPTEGPSADQRARELRQHAEILIKSEKYDEAIKKLNQALNIAGISDKMESELENLRIEVVTMASNKRRAR